VWALPDSAIPIKHPGVSDVARGRRHRCRPARTSNISRPPGASVVARWAARAVLMAGARAMVTAGAGASPKDTSTLMRVRDGTSGAPSLRSERTLAVDALSRRMRRSEHAGQISFSFSVFLSEAHSAFPARKAAQGVGLACEFQRIGVHVCDTAQGVAVALWRSPRHPKPLSHQHEGEHITREHKSRKQCPCFLYIFHFHFHLKVAKARVHGATNKTLNKFFHSIIKAKN